MRTRVGCRWDARAGVSWISISAGSSGAGDGEVRYRVSENSSTSERSGTLTVAGTAVTVRQRGAEPPRTENVNIEGTVGRVGGSCPSLSMTVGGESVGTDSSTRFKHGACGDIRPGITVRVKGQRTGSAPIRAEDVDIR